MSMQVLEAALGLSFVYLLFSIIASAFNELAAGLLALRQGTLRRGIAQLLSDSPLLAKQLQQAIYDLPLIKGLSHGTGARKAPSYIDKDIFAAALIAALKRDGAYPPPAGQQSSTAATNAAANPGNAPVGQQPSAATTTVAANPKPWADVTSALSALAVGQTVEHWRDAAAMWFDVAMDRVSGTYKRMSQVMLVSLSLVIVLGFDVDTIAIVRVLWTDPQVRASVASRAAAYAAPDLAPSSDAVAQIKAANERYSRSMHELDALDIPLGWPKDFWSKGPDEIVAKAFGLLLSVIAISLGAPFWFDVLNKVSRLRAAGTTPDEKRRKAA